MRLPQIRLDDRELEMGPSPADILEAKVKNTLTDSATFLAEALVLVHALMGSAVKEGRVRIRKEKESISATLTVEPGVDLRFRVGLEPVLVAITGSRVVVTASAVSTAGMEVDQLRLMSKNMAYMAYVMENMEAAFAHTRVLTATSKTMEA